MNETNQLHLKETRRQYTDWIQLIPSRDQCQVLANRRLITGLHQTGICNKLGCETFNKGHELVSCSCYSSGNNSSSVFWNLRSNFSVTAVRRAPNACTPRPTLPTRLAHSNRYKIKKNSTVGQRTDVGTSSSRRR